LVIILSTLSNVIYATGIFSIIFGNNKVSERIGFSYEKEAEIAKEDGMGKFFLVLLLA